MPPPENSNSPDQPASKKPALPPRTVYVERLDSCTIEERLWDTRAKLAGATLALLAATVLGGLGLVGIHHLAMQDFLNFLQPVLPAEVGLAGSAIAFYFGGRNEAGEKKST